MLQTLAKIFITGTGQTQTHEGCRWTPFTLHIHVDHTFFEDTKVIFRSILQRCESSLIVFWDQLRTSASSSLDVSKTKSRLFDGNGPNLSDSETRV